MFKIGDHVINPDHPEYGVGVIVAIDGDEFRWERLGSFIVTLEGTACGGTSGPKGNWQKFDPELN